MGSRRVLLPISGGLGVPQSPILGMRRILDVMWIELLSTPGWGLIQPVSVQSSALLFSLVLVRPHGQSAGFSWS